MNKINRYYKEKELKESAIESVRLLEKLDELFDLKQQFDSDKNIKKHCSI